MAPHTLAIHPGQLNIPPCASGRRWSQSFLPTPDPASLYLQTRSESIGDANAENGYVEYQQQHPEEHQYQIPEQNYLARPSPLQQFQRQNQLHSSCSSLPNTPPQMARENPFVENRDRSQTLIQQQYPTLEDRTFQHGNNRLGGVTDGQTIEINDGGASFVRASQQQMTPIQSAFPFQDPKIILSKQPPHQSTTSNANSAQRRRLPQVPNTGTSNTVFFNQTESIINQSPSPQFGTNPLQEPPTIGRISSPRMLPTPPPIAVSPTQPTMNTINTFSPSPSPPFSNTECNRRPSSTGRRLPLEPVSNLSPGSLPPPTSSHLQRSASARTATSVSNSQMNR